LDQLAFTPARNAKLTLLRDYLSHAPDPERGWALASLTGALSFDAAKPGFIRKAAEARMDPLLFALSHDFVGDLAETVALIWPAKPAPIASRNCPRWWKVCAAPRAGKCRNCWSAGWTRWMPPAVGLC
ncbi:MAG TPA: hypothetical protein VFA87_01265, partial [Rhizomicrobium sp.]|nr:hypothetical protein [Rhizomicrobium sp.]